MRAPRLSLALVQLHGAVGAPRTEQRAHTAGSSGPRLHSETSSGGAGRRLVAASLPLAAVVLAWSFFESSPRPILFLGIAALALPPCLPATLPLRVTVAAATFTGLAAGVAGWTPMAIRGVLDRALSDMATVAPPFVATRHHDLHVFVILAAAAFCLVIAITAGSRPFVTAVATVGGVATPTTILPARNTVTMGALALLAALWPLLLGRVGERRALASGAVPVACVVAAATLVVGAGARPSTPALHWQSWDLFGELRVARTVALVWSTDYGGIDFPAGETTVLRITAPRRALYWRATTLDTFAGDRWVESLYATTTSTARRRLPGDSLLPAAAASGGGWVRQEIDVRALVDHHVIAAGQPMRIDGGARRRIRYLSGGVMLAPDGLGEMRRYTVWSYAPAPTPAALVRSPPVYPESLARYRDIGRTIVPPFGAAGRTAAVSAIFHDDLYEQLWPYAGMWRDAQRLTAESGSPYEATIRIERWLRSDGGFAYDEHPPLALRAPPLVDFLERTKLGYCQQFAGTMALMLRYLGIPARVAVGFTSGTWKDGTWTVTDHDAHAWVEAWFAGYGWLTFDPTPSRGTLSATYTNASDSADAIRALGTGRFLGSAPRSRTTAPRVARPAVGAADRTTAVWLLLIPFAAVATALLALGAMKSLRRLHRASTKDPRGRASASRAELAEFVRDQGSNIASTASAAELGLELRRFGVGSDAFLAAFRRARYGPPADAPAAADEARRELQRILSILRSRLGPGRRLRGFFAVRSLRR